MSDEFAILIEPHGTITTPHFPGEADPDHPGGRYWHIRSLIDTADPGAVELPGPVELTIWIDGHALDRRRSVNTTATFLVWDVFNSIDTLICGPLLITGGTKEHPAPLSREQAHKVASDLLDIDPTAITDENAPFTAEHLLIFDWRAEDGPGKRSAEAES
jgi:hypothetical protein